MPVLKVYKNGSWEELGGTSPMDGGNADTLDGKHASEFASVDAVNELETNTISGFEQVESGFEYFYNQIGGDTSVPDQINNAIDNLYDYGTNDLTAGSSALQTGKLYFVYE